MAKTAKLALSEAKGLLGKMLPKERKLISNISAAILILILLILGYGLYRSIEARFGRVHESQYIMGTVIEIKINGPNAKELARAAMEEIKRISKLINYYDEESELSNINKMAGITSVSVSRDTFDIIKKAVQMSRLTSGSFDVTIAPLMDVWDFRSRDRKDIPSGNELVYAQHLVNYQNIELDNGSETIKLLYPGMKIDLGGIAKGYAIGRVREILIKNGVKSAMISTGSSITVVGLNSDGRPWRVGIKNPRKPEDIIGIVELNGGQSLSTSGDYERYFEVGGKRYHHIIDPMTGMPATGAQSVTIISDDSSAADALSTAVFVMGPTKGLNFLTRVENTSAVIVDKNGNILTTPGLILER